MNVASILLLLVVPAFLSISIGIFLLRRAFSRSKILPEEIALAGAWIYVVGALVWLGVYLGGGSLLGFGAPWSWLAALHFMFAGFGSLTVTALACRVVSSSRSLRVLRLLLLAHPAAYLMTAAGISGFRFGEEWGAIGYALIFYLQFFAFTMGRRREISDHLRVGLTFALAVPLVTILPALAWAWDRPVFDLPDMVRYHGIVNAVGHVGLGLLVFLCCRPRAHAPLLEAQK